MRVALFILALCIIPGAFAANPDPEVAQKIVRETTDKMRDVLLANRVELDSDSSRIKDYVREIMLPHFDELTVAKLVLGQHWRNASPGQQQNFTREFRDLLVHTYAKALLEYIDADIDYLPTRPSKRANRVTVRSNVVPGNRSAIPIDYTMCHDGQQWKVCNLTIDRSINFVVNYREQIGSQVSREGLDEVIDSLRQQNNLANG